MCEHKYKAKRIDGQWVQEYYFAKPILNLHFNYPHYPIFPACQNCPNHSSNGGSGNCNCILGGYDFTCNTEV